MVTLEDALNILNNDQILDSLMPELFQTGLKKPRRRLHRGGS